MQGAHPFELLMNEIQIQIQMQMQNANAYANNKCKMHMQIQMQNAYAKTMPNARPSWQCIAKQEELKGVLQNT